MHMTVGEMRNLVQPGSSASTSIQKESGKLFQVMSEFVDGYEKMSNVHPSVSIFGSSRIGPNNHFYTLTQEIACALSDVGFSVVSGGGPGLMEAANRGAQQGKSPSIGLNIILPGKQEMPNAYQDISIHFHNFFVRKVMFVKYASAYVVMPGGFDTLDELVECLTLMQTDKTVRIPVILVHSPFWSGLIDWFQDSMLEHGTIERRDLELFQVLDQPDEICNAIFDFYETNGFNQLSDKEKIKLEF